jgi:hypothetical protein
VRGERAKSGKAEEKRPRGLARLASALPFVRKSA